MSSKELSRVEVMGRGPRKGRDGKLAITFPMGDKKLPGIAAEDIGECAYGIFKRGNEFVGQTVAISGENLTGAQIAAVKETQPSGQGLNTDSNRDAITPVSW